MGTKIQEMGGTVLPDLKRIPTPPPQDRHILPADNNISREGQLLILIFRAWDFSSPVLTCVWSSSGALLLWITKSHCVKKTHGLAG